MCLLLLQLIDVTHKRIVRCKFKRTIELKQPLIKLLPHGLFNLRLNGLTDYNLLGSLLTTEKYFPQNDQCFV